MAEKKEKMMSDFEMADGWTGCVALSDSENIVPFIGIHPDKKAIEKYYKSTFGHMLSEGGYRAQFVRILPQPSTPQPGMVTVPRYLVEQASLLLDNASQVGVEVKYINGGETPNAKLCRETHLGLDAALRSGERETSGE